jgi:hypothetical protein
MISPLTRILIKLFARGFYRANAGLLLSFFVIIVSYTILITPAGTMNHELFEFSQLIVMLTFISSPVTLSIIFLAWLLYTIKSWQYVSIQLTANENGFLFYSSTSMSRFRQLQSWWWMQAVITLPLTVYGLLSVIFGIAHQHFLFPFITLVYLFLLITGSAGIYVWQANRLSAGVPKTFAFKLPTRWPKPFFSLFLYYIIHRLKTGGIITKALSVFCLCSGVYAIASRNRHDVRVGGLVLLTAVAAHVYLVYQEHRFDIMTLSFARNFPYSRNRLFTYTLLRYLLLLAPEIVLLYVLESPLQATLLSFYAISVLSCFRGLLYLTGLNMNIYLPLVFLVYILLFWLIMYGYLWPSACVNLLLGYILFYNSYYSLPSLV